MTAHLDAELSNIHVLCLTPHLSARRLLALTDNLKHARQMLLLRSCHKQLRKRSWEWAVSVRATCE